MIDKKRAEELQLIFHSRAQSMLDQVKKLPKSKRNAVTAEALRYRDASILLGAAVNAGMLEKIDG
jgi:hypothetical protein